MKNIKVILFAKQREFNGITRLKCWVPKTEIKTLIPSLSLQQDSACSFCCTPKWWEAE